MSQNQKILVGSVVLALVCFFTSPAVRAEDGANIDEAPVVERWKGASPDREWRFGLMTGAGIYDNLVGWAVLANASKKIIDRGFVEEINDQVFIEAMGGPLVLNFADGVLYAIHLRWDFHMNETWAFYSTGGVGGSIRGNSWRFFPRFSMGTMATVAENLALRAEVSHEWIAGGVNVAF